MKKPPIKHYFFDPLWRDNQILVAVLGICSALAITIQVKPALVMALCVMFVTSLSSLFVSLIRHWIPDDVRMIAQLVIVSSFVIIVDQFLRAYFYELSKILSVFVGLIITNCLVMGRTESIARKTPPLPAFLDGLGAATGYSIVILAVSAIREFFGAGSLLGFKLLPSFLYATAEHPDRYVNFNIMALAPSAFFILGCFIWLYNIFSPKEAP